MKTLFIILNIFVILRTFALEEVFIGIGESYNISVSEKAPIKVINKKNLIISDQNSSIHITGKKKGISYLHINSKKIKINILKQANKEHYLILKTALLPIRGLKISLNNEGKLTIIGHLLRKSDFLKIIQLTDAYKIPFLWKAKINKNDELFIHQTITRLFKDRYLHKITLNSTSPLTASINSKIKDKKEIKTNLLHWGIDLETNLSTNPGAQTIQTQVFFIETTRGFHRSLGIKWGDSTKLHILNKNIEHDPSLTVYLQHLEQQGYGSVIASPVLITQNRRETSFLSGGEIPIKSSSVHTSNVSWKQYGLKLSVTPTLYNDQSINHQLNIEVSSLDMSNSINGIPALKTNSVKTHFTLEKNNTIMLTGFLKNITGKSALGIPFLQRVPILNALFKSKDFIQKKSTLSIFVTSKVINHD